MRRLLLAIGIVLLSAQSLAQDSAQSGGPVYNDLVDVSDPALWAASDGDGSVKIKLYLFWSVHCPHCRDALAFLQSLERALPWLHVMTFEVSQDPTNADYYRRIGVPLGARAANVPGIAYCGKLLQGYQSDETTGAYLRDTLIQCRERWGEASSENFAQATPETQPPPLREISLPFISPVDPAVLSLPVLTIFLAALDAFNPCAFFVLLFLLSLMVRVRSRLRMAVVGGVFVLFSGLAYFVFMAAWLNLFKVIGHLSLATVVAGLLAVGVAALNIKDYFAFHKGLSLSIPEAAKPGLYQRTRNLVNASSMPAMLAGTVVLAVFANMYELLCTAGLPMIYTRILTMRDLSDVTHYLHLALYNLVYVVPLAAIVAIFVVTLGARKLTEREGRILKLASGMMMLGLGLVLLVAPQALENLFLAVFIVVLAIAATALIARITKPRIVG